jgi:hypothetical protein
MVNPNRFYTYAYLRKDRTPYYIGKGCGRRIYARDGRPCNKPKNKSRIVLLKKNLTEEEAFKHEKYMIFVFGRKDLGTGILHNRTDGGEGSSGRVLSTEQRQHLSEIKKGKKLYDITEKTRQKMSVSQSKRTHTEESKKKISLAHKGKPKPKLSNDHKEKIRSSLCKNKWLVEFPNGETLEVINLKQFCIENNLNVGHISSRRKSKGYKVTKILE